MKYCPICGKEHEIVKFGNWEMIACPFYLRIDPLCIDMDKLRALIKGPIDD